MLFIPEGCRIAALHQNARAPLHTHGRARQSFDRDHRRNGQFENVTLVIHSALIRSREQGAHGSHHSGIRNDRARCAGHRGQILRNIVEPQEYGSYPLPSAVLRRLECLLQVPTKTRDSIWRGKDLCGGPVRTSLARQARRTARFGPRQLLSEAWVVASRQNSDGRPDDRPLRVDLADRRL